VLFAGVPGVVGFLSPPCLYTKNRKEVNHDSHCSPCGAQRQRKNHPRRSTSILHRGQGSHGQGRRGQHHLGLYTRGKNTPNLGSNGGVAPNLPRASNLSTRCARLYRFCGRNSRSTGGRRFGGGGGICRNWRTDWNRAGLDGSRTPGAATHGGGEQAGKGGAIFLPCSRTCAPPSGTSSRPTCRYTKTGSGSA